MKTPKHISFKHRQIEQTRTVVLTVVVVASIILSITLVVAKNLFDDWSFNNRHYGAQQEAIAALEQNIEALEGIKVKFAAFESSGATTSKDVLDALPARYDFNALNTSLQFLADRAGVSVSSISGEDMEISAINEAYTPEPVELLFFMEVNGSYTEIQNFVSLLDQSIRPIRIDRIEMSGSDQNMTIELSGATFYQPAQNLDYPDRSIE